MRLPALLLIVASCAAAADTLCAPGERVVFSCAIGKAGKRVSLCASPDLARGKGSLTYRFGRPGRIELQFPRAHATPGAGPFRYAHAFGPRADRTEITFRSGGADYTVFRYDDSDDTSEGVRVSQAGRTRELACSGASVADFTTLADALPCDEDNALANCK